MKYPLQLYLWPRIPHIQSGSTEHTDTARCMSPVGAKLKACVDSCYTFTVAPLILDSRIKIFGAQVGSKASIT
jgi:hypothetical protein